MRRPSNRPARRGFTLAEIMVSVLLVVMGVTVWGTTFVPATLALNRSRHFDLAATACAGELEAWRARGYSQIPNGGGAVVLDAAHLIRPLPADLPNASGQLVIRRAAVMGSGPTYSYQTTGTDTGRLSLEMTIHWHGASNDEGTVRLTTLVLQ